MPSGFAPTHLARSVLRNGPIVALIAFSWLLPAADQPLKFSRDSALCREPFELSIASVATPGTIYFTTNGSVPTPASPQYKRPIPIAGTTVVRATARNPGTPLVDGRAFIFLRDVIKQTGEGFPKTWGLNHGKPVVADYEMDPEIVQHFDYRGLLAASLEALPSLSIVMTPDDLFGADRGIYSHAQESGSASERPASIQMIGTNGQNQFSANCGIRIQGGWNRRPEESPKHSFRLTFKKKYGPAKLRCRLFEKEEDFETLILRGGNNNSWLHWSGEERRRADFVRDQWMRDSYAAMGNPSARGFFVHLYLNGLYWGLYNLCERPSAPFAAAHFGGKPENYDSRNADKILEGDPSAWNELFRLANAGVADAKAYAAVSELLDLQAFGDFMIVNLYGANADWDRSSNWYAARRRNPSGKFHFFVWDGERTLEKVNDNTLAFDDDQSPARLFQKLRLNREFRTLFAARVRKHCFGDGALTPKASGDRFRFWANQLDLAIIAESARWGDYRRDVHPYKTGPYELYTRNEHWRPEIDRLLNDYFPKRTAIAVEQFRSADLFPGPE